MSLQHSPTDNPNPPYDEKAELDWERTVQGKTWEIKMRISTKEGAAKFIHDYEPDFSAIVAYLASGDYLAATTEFYRMINKYAEFEVESEKV